jgi:CubicO group peptidase (beta-lactamase class C family)
MMPRVVMVVGIAAVAGLCRGVGAQSLADIDAIVRSGITKGVYPGAVVVVGRADRVLLARGYGRFTWQPDSPVPDPDGTLWDIASLTKVVSTTSSIMILVDEGRLDLDAPVARYLPRFQGDRKDQVTVRMLLNHTSGMRSYVQFFKLAEDRDEAIDLLYQEPLQRAPGAKPVYSDLNAMLLGLVVEEVSGESLDQFALREVFRPVSMDHTRYSLPRAQRELAAPTGRWRGHPVGGVVNDQNAVILGGVAGHAGVFSTGTDLARYATWWLKHGDVDSGPVVEPATMQAFLSRTPSSGSRLLGWDTRDPEYPPPSVFGDLLSRSAYGHTGWTGTELWIDPERDLFLVFLTNRSYAPKVSHSISALRRVRAELSEAVVRAVPGACQPTIVPTC